jgi:sulfur carrier protein
MITIWVNEVPLEIEINFNILQLLQKLESPLNGIAIAINNEISSKDLWHKQQLANNDRILIIQATQGG